MPLVLFCEVLYETPAKVLEKFIELLETLGNSLLRESILHPVFL